MGINLGAGFENLNGNSSISNQSAGILNLNKNDILDLTKKSWIKESKTWSWMGYCK